MNQRLGAVLLIAVACRFVLLAAAWQDRARAFTPDSDGYWTLANSLTRGEFRRTGETEIFRTPGYPAYLLPFAALDASGGWRLALGAQVAIDVVLVYMTYLLARRIVGDSAWLAAGVQAVAPAALAASCRVLSDGLFAALLTASVLMISRHFRSARAGPLLIAAGLMGAACYVRPLGLALSGIFVFVLLCRPKRLARAGVFAAVVAACVAPWIVRNAGFGDFTGFSSLPAEGLYRYSARVTAGAAGQSTSNAPPTLTTRTASAAESPGQRARRMRADAMDVIAEHPGTFVRTHLLGCIGTALPAAPDVLEILGFTAGQRGTIEALRRDGPFAAARHYFAGRPAGVALAVPLTMIYLVALVGVVACVAGGPWRKAAPETWLAAGLTAACLLLPGVAGHPRFRVPVTPLLSIAAAAGLSRLAGRILPKRKDGSLS